MWDTSDFLGRGFAFPPRIDPVTGQFEMCSGEEDIRQSIYIIVMTRKNERAMMPQFGCNLHNYVFDLPEPSVITMLRSEVVEALAKFEPRIVDVEVEVDTSDMRTGKVLLNIRYVVRDTNNPNNLVFPYYLYEGVGTE